MLTSALSPATRPSAVISRLRIPATTSGFVAKTRATDVTSRLVRATRRRSDEVRPKLGLTLRDLLLEGLKTPMQREKARRSRRSIRPKVNRGSENWVFVVLTEETSLINRCFSSASEFAAMVFSSDVCRRDGRACAKEMGGAVTVDPGLSSLYTTDSIAITSFSISSTNGKNESTIESRIP